MNEELLKKAKAAGSPEELLKMAHENGMSDFDEESAKAYYDLINRSGELSDSELENAAGGCKNKGRTVVTRGTICPVYYPRWRCRICHAPDSECIHFNMPQADFFGVTAETEVSDICNTCAHMIKEKGLWLCTEPIVNSR